MIALSEAASSRRVYRPDGRLYELEAKAGLAEPLNPGVLFFYWDLASEKETGRGVALGNASQNESIFQIILKLSEILLGINIPVIIIVFRLYQTELIIVFFKQGFGAHVTTQSFQFSI